MFIAFCAIDSAATCIYLVVFDFAILGLLRVEMHHYAPIIPLLYVKIPED